MEDLKHYLKYLEEFEIHNHETRKDSESEPSYDEKPTYQKKSYVMYQ